MSHRADHVVFGQRPHSATPSAALKCIKVGAVFFPVFYAESTAEPPFTLLRGRQAAACSCSFLVGFGRFCFLLLIIGLWSEETVYFHPPSAMSAATLSSWVRIRKRRKFNQVSVIKRAIGLHGLLSLPFFLSQVFGPFVIVRGAGDRNSTRSLFAAPAF